MRFSEGGREGEVGSDGGEKREGEGEVMHFEVDDHLKERWGENGQNSNDDLDRMGDEEGAPTNEDLWKRVVSTSQKQLELR